MTLDAAGGGWPTLSGHYTRSGSGRRGHVQGTGFPITGVTMRREMRDVIVLQISTGVPWAHGGLEPIGKILQETMKSTTVTSRMLASAASAFGRGRR
jgi:hypothetical protein